MTILFKSEDDHHTPLVKSRLPISYNNPPQILFDEFIDWALSRDLDIDDDKEPEED